MVSKLPISALKAVLENADDNGQMTVRIRQLIMMWIHRVLLVALLSFLRLNGEAIIAMAKSSVLANEKEKERGSISSLPGNNMRRSVTTFTPYKTSFTSAATSGVLEAIAPDADFRWGVLQLKKC